MMDVNAANMICHRLLPLHCPVIGRVAVSFMSNPEQRQIAFRLRLADI